MREVKKWSKDCITGKIIEQEVFKPDNGLIGRAKIELIGEDGQLKQEVYTENIIPDKLNRGYFYNMLFNSIVMGDEIYSYESTVKNGIGPMATAFSKIVLSNDDMEESEDNLFYRGDVIGWCPRTSASPGSDVTRGMYVSAESFKEITTDMYYHVHRVYEFGTTQGNGTINSIWWQRDGSAKYNTSPTSSSPTYFVNHAPFTLAGITTNTENQLGYTLYRGADKKYYYAKSGSYYEVLNLDNYLKGWEKLKISASPNANFVHYNKTVRDGSYVKVTTSYTSGNVETFTTTVNFELCEPNTGEVIGSKDIVSVKDALVNIDQYFDMSGKSFYVYPEKHLVRDNGDVILFFYAYVPSSATNKFPDWDLTTDDLTTSKTSQTVYFAGVYNVFSKTWVVRPGITKESMAIYNRRYSYHETHWGGKLPTTTSYSVTLPTLLEKTTGGKLTKFGKDYYFNSLDEFAIFEMEEGVYDKVKITPFACLQNIGVSSSSPGISCYIEEYDVVTTTDSLYVGGGGITTFQVMPYSAHTKLPAPVVKTSSDTMKVQYDYYIQIPAGFAKDGDYLTYTPPATLSENDGVIFAYELDDKVEDVQQIEEKETSEDVE